MLPVILFHGGFPFVTGGYVGVDVFFVISGYLITRLIREEMGDGRWSLARFYERRARRILPPLFLVVLACIPLAWLLMLPDDLANFARSISAVSVFASNVLFWLQTGYFDRAGEFKPLLHTWSLAVEEQFYLLFPLLLLLLRQASRRLLLAVLAGLLVVSLGTAQWWAWQAPAAGFYLLPSRAWELALGALIAVSGIEAWAGRGNRLAADMLGLGGIALILAAVFAFDSTTPTPSVWTLIPTLGTAMLLAAAHPGTTAGTVLSWRPVVAVGLVSYSAYLWHFPLIVFARFAGLSAAPILFGLAITALSLLLAGLTWFLIERPFRDRRKLRLGPFAAITLAMVLTANLFAGYVLLRQDGSDPRLSEAQNRLLETALPSPLRKKCHIPQGQYRPPEASCRFFVDQPDIAVLGNSHGVELAYALASRLKDADRGVIQFTFSSCPPVYGRTLPERPLCSRWTRNAVDYIAGNRDISTVVISYYTDGLAGEKQAALPDTGTAEDTPTDNGKPDEQWRSYSATVERFLAAGKTVILVLQAPHLEDHVQKFAMAARTTAEMAFYPGVGRARWDASRQNILSRLATLPKGVIVIDPADAFCDASACAAVKDGAALYFDQHHMSLAGAGLIADEIIPLLPPRAVTPLQQVPAPPVPAEQTSPPAAPVEERPPQQVPAPPLPPKAN